MSDIVARFRSRGFVSPQHGGFDGVQDLRRNAAIRYWYDRSARGRESVSASVLLWQPVQHPIRLQSRRARYRSSSANIWKGTPVLTPHSDFGFIHLLDEKARTHPEAVYATCEGDALDTRTLRSNALRWQQFFEDQGLSAGDRVGLMLNNSFDAIAILFALLRTGLVWLPINPALKGSNLAYLISHAGPRLVIAEASLAEAYLEARAGSDPVHASGSCSGADQDLDSARIPAKDALLVRRLAPSSFSVDLPAERDVSAGPLSVRSSAPAALMYTSGTTGPPKGVIVSHAMMRIAAEGGLIASQGEDGDVFFYWESMGHIGGAQVLLFPLLRDITLAMVPRFSASRFWQQTREARATHIHYLGGILQMLLNQPSSPRDREHPVRVAWGGGCTRETSLAFQQRFGVPTRECYGMTEASSIATVADGSAPGSVGRALPWMRVSIRDGGGTPLPAGEQGEIVLETDVPEAFFSGYFENPEATAAALRCDRLHTGDLGTIDRNGDLFYLGRLTESIRCRGENVSAWEVEHVLLEHPAVSGAAVIGVDAEVGEQDIMAFIEFGVVEPPSYRDVVRWLEPRLARYQLPRYFKTVTAFERTASQRIRKHLLDTGIDGSWDRLGG
ncbi:AMP-binding protein [Leucobacter sp. CSA1]|uniref:AMP-binding protein n=1 Tax=Leucobacter chromiisoli TaxID=2796471 RepID=A0A934Q5Z7_9MICO|nr:AMP-binding protein [Leucobacter chromiisoli]MBK0418298.1 AMP-binding protein [Leucobacter chromiisoli]